MGLGDLRKLINKEFGASIMTNAVPKKSVEMPRFSSGSLTLDIDLGGGWPETRIIEIFGPESSGKSFLLYQAMKTITSRKKNNRVAIFDQESVWDEDAEWPRAIGVDLKNVEVLRPTYAEEVCDIMELIVESGEFALVALDSIGALISKEELDKSHENQQMAPIAKLLAKVTRKIVLAQNKSLRKGTPTAVIFLNQMMMRVGMVFGNPETTKGGKALRHFASIRLDLRQDREVDKEDLDVVGVTANYTVVKNKTAAPQRKGDFTFYVDQTSAGWEKGSINNDRALFQLGRETGAIVQAGSHFSGRWLGEKKHHGQKAAFSYLQSLTSDEKNKMIEDLQSSANRGRTIAFRFPKDKPVAVPDAVPDTASSTPPGTVKDTS